MRTWCRDRPSAPSALDRQGGRWTEWPESGQFLPALKDHPLLTQSNHLVLLVPEGRRATMLQKALVNY